MYHQMFFSLKGPNSAVIVRKNVPAVNGAGVASRRLQVCGESGTFAIFIAISDFFANNSSPHGTKDKEYAEDKHVLGRNSWSEAWTVLTNIAVSEAI
jgi:hypothetical protein